MKTNENGLRENLSITLVQITNLYEIYEQLVFSSICVKDAYKNKYLYFFCNLQYQQKCFACYIMNYFVINFLSLMHALRF